MILLIIFSQSIIDYSTSGLENPLSFLLLGFFFWAYTKEKPAMILWLIFSLIFLNRPDSILLVMPLLAYKSFSIIKLSGFKSAFYSIFIGTLPLFSWLIFSLFYYGLYIPNTAYAKLNSNISQIELIVQGIYYFFDSLKYDPVTLIVIFFSITFSFTILKKKSKQALLALGVIMYLFYILKIGGDFMSGRFFALPYFASLIVISGISFNNLKEYSHVALPLIFIGIISISVNNSSLLREVDGISTNQIKRIGLSR